jgi:hypothetical protein
MLKSKLSGLLPLTVIAAVSLCCATGATNAQWWKDVDGCLVTEHIKGNGKRWVIAAGQGYSYVGGKWNDKISTVICEVYCHLQAWEHRDYQGATRTFSGSGAVGRNGNPFVGNAWNDRISSLRAWCDP